MEHIKLLFNQFADKPVAYYPVYAKITGSITAGILLSQLIYWDKVMKHEPFWKTDNDFCDELCMGLYEIKAAKKKLSEIGVVDIKRKGLPARTYYKVNIETIIRRITSYGKNPQLESGKTHNLSREKPTTNITENTSENTSDILKPSLSQMEKPNKKQQNPFLSDSNEIRLSKLLFSLILKNNPKVKAPNIQVWAKDISLAIKRDNRTVEDLEKVIRWCQGDVFWSCNILSAKKLREKFDQLWVKMNAEKSGSNKQQPVITDEIKKYRDELNRKVIEDPYAD